MLLNRAVLFSWLLLVGLSAGSCKPAQSPDSVVTAEDEATKAKAREVRSRRYAETFAGAFDVMRSEPGAIGTQIEQTIAERAYVVSVPNLPDDAPANVVRLQLAAASKTYAGRLIMRRAAQAGLTNRSNALKNALFASEEISNPARVFDYLVVGSGPQGVAFASKMTDIAPDLKGLMVSSDRGAGGTFEELFEAFYLNSTNRQNTGERARPGRGDLNFFNDVLYITDFRGRKWTPAGDIGYVANIAAAVSGTNNLFQTEVLEVVDSQVTGETFPARYKVRMRDNNSGKVFDSFTQVLVTATGIGGQPVFRGLEEGAVRVANANGQVRANAPAWEVPDVQTFQQAAENAAKSEYPLRPYKEKTVLLVGPGDSGKVFAELLSRLGPEEAYKADVAQTGADPKRIIWLVGEDFETCKQYLDKARARYSQISSALNAGTLIPVAGRLKDLKRVGEGRYVPQIDYALDLRNPNSRLLLEFGELTYVKPDRLDATGLRTVNRNGQVYIEESRLEVNKIVLATGFDSRLAEILEPVVGLEGVQKLQADPVESRPEGFDKNVKIAFRIKGKAGAPAQNIFAIASASLPFGGLLEPEELAKVSANKVSIFGNHRRTEQLAIEIAGLFERGELARVGSRLQLTVTQGIELFGNEAASTVREPVERRVTLSDNADLEVRAQLATLIAVEEKIDKSFKVTFEPEFDEASKVRNVLIKVAETSVNQEGLLQFTRALRRNGLINVLGTYFETAQGKVGSLEIEVPVIQGNRGQLVMNAADLNLDQIQMIRRRVGSLKAAEAVAGLPEEGTPMDRTFGAEYVPKTSVSEPGRIVAVYGEGRSPQLGDLVSYRSKGASGEVKLGSVFTVADGLVTLVKDVATGETVEVNGSDVTPKGVKTGTLVRIIDRPGDGTFILRGVSRQGNTETAALYDPATRRESAAPLQSLVQVGIEANSLVVVSGQVCRVKSYDLETGRTEYFSLNENTSRTGLLEQLDIKLPLQVLENLQVGDRLFDFSANRSVSLLGILKDRTGIIKAGVASLPEIIALTEQATSRVINESGSLSDAVINRYQVEVDVLGDLRAGKGVLLQDGTEAEVERILKDVNNRYILRLKPFTEPNASALRTIYAVVSAQPTVEIIDVDLPPASEVRLQNGQVFKVVRSYSNGTVSALDLQRNTLVRLSKTDLQSGSIDTSKTSLCGRMRVAFGQ